MEKSKTADTGMLPMLEERNKVTRRSVMLKNVRRL